MILKFLIFFTKFTISLIQVNFNSFIALVNNQFYHSFIIVISVIIVTKFIYYFVHSSFLLHSCYSILIILIIHINLIVTFNTLFFVIE